ncbi:hypothetical protein BTHE68_72560 (plasmid) [Burkholderia sp. THE68]|nr:hypothetical protein BTHE68_72560 [Burkholderia sp. THE68]
MITEGRFKGVWDWTVPKLMSFAQDIGQLPVSGEFQCKVRNQHRRRRNRRQPAQRAKHPVRSEIAHRSTL